jgi:hypothetical protein
LPSALQSIGDLAFYNCTGLKDLTISTSITSIGNNAFDFCEELMVKFELPSNLVNIGTFAFCHCSKLSEFVFSNNITILNDYILAETALTNIILPNSITRIGGRAFESCHKLNSVTLSNSLISIGDYAFAPFYGSSATLTELSLPSTIKSVSNSAFMSVFVETLNINSFGEIATVLGLLTGGGLNTGKLTALNVIIQPNDTDAALISRIQGILALTKSSNALLNRGAAAAYAIDATATTIAAASCPEKSGDIAWSVKFHDGIVA